MKTSTTTIGGQQFLKIPLIEVRQKGVVFYLGCVPVNDVLACYTVEPAVYDQAQEAMAVSRFSDDAEWLEFRRMNRQAGVDKKAFQRKEYPARVREIGKWLDEEEYAIFPNTIIATCDLANDFLGVQEGASLSDLVENKEIDPNKMASCYLANSAGDYCLYVPRKRGSLLVIDGQHRLKGLERASDSTRQQYSILVSFILGFDRSIVAKIFYTVNYTQKSVNKSLLYQLTGEFSYELNEITFLHEVVRLLNEISKSPFFNRIKMLGTVPLDVHSSTRALMTVSQAFLIEYLLPLIVCRSKSMRSPPAVFSYYYNDKAKQIEIPRFLIRYFSAVRSLVGDKWSRPAENMISKTVSVGALMRLIPYVYLQAVYVKKYVPPEDIAGISEEHICSILKGIETVDTSTCGPFGRISSEGSVSKLLDAFVKATKELGNVFSREGQAAVYRESFMSWLMKNT